MRSKARSWALKNCPCSSRLCHLKSFFCHPSIFIFLLLKPIYLHYHCIYRMENFLINILCVSSCKKVFISKKIMIFHTSYSFFNNLFVYDTLQIMKVLHSTFIFHLSMKSIIKKLLNLEIIILLAL